MRGGGRRRRRNCHENNQPFILEDASEIPNGLLNNLIGRLTLWREELITFRTHLKLLYTPPLKKKIVQNIQSRLRHSKCLPCTR